MCPPARRRNEPRSRRRERRRLAASPAQLTPKRCRWLPWLPWICATSRPSSCVLRLVGQRRGADRPVSEWPNTRCRVRGATACGTRGAA